MPADHWSEVGPGAKVGGEVTCLSLFFEHCAWTMGWAKAINVLCCDGGTVAVGADKNLSGRLWELGGIP